MSLVNLIEKTFGRLTVVSRAENDSSGNAKWTCACACGNSVAVRGYSLKSGGSTSCGCFKRETAGHQNFTHMRTETPEYNSWMCMKARCLNVKLPAFKNYGGRRITICDRWLESFENFFADMGPRPSRRHTIDRINNDGNYEPGNCRWATRFEQRHNQRPHKLRGFMIGVAL